MTLSEITRETTQLSNLLVALNREKFWDERTSELAQLYMARLAVLDAQAELLRATGAGRERASA